MKDVIDPVEVMCWAMVRASGVPTARKLNEDPAWRYHEPAIRAALTAAAEAGWVLVKQEEIARLQAVYRAARGLCYGEDWNNGTHAKTYGYRMSLIDAVHAVEPLPKDIAKAASE